MPKPFELVVLDMDGVLADFDGGVRKVFGMPEGWRPKSWDGLITEIDSSMTPDAFWARIESTPYFWSNLEATPWKEELIFLAEQIGEEWMVVTSPSHDPRCWMEKIEWLYEHVEMKFRKVALTPAKHWLAAPGRLLIDDCDVHAKIWRERGGTAVTFPAPWNEAREYVDDPMKAIYEELGI